MKAVRIGIVGAGFIADKHLIGFSEARDAVVTAVTSRTEEHAREFSRKHKIERWFTDYKKMVELEDIDVVDICTPNYLHEPIAVAAAEAGKHIICEKPMAVDLQQCDRMIEAAKRAGVKLMYAEDMVFAPMLLKAKELIDDDSIGKLFLARTNEMHSGPHTEWFWKLEESGGGPVMDMGIHGAYALSWIMGSKVRKVYAEMGTLVHKIEIEDNAIVILRFENDAMGEMVNSWSTQGGMDTRMELFGTEGNIHINMARGTPLLAYSQKGYGKHWHAAEKGASTSGWSFPIVDEDRTFGHVQELVHFVECVSKDKKPLLTGEDGREALEIVLAAYKSSKLNKPVELPLRGD